PKRLRKRRQNPELLRGLSTSKTPSLWRGCLGGHSLARGLKPKCSMLNVQCSMFNVRSLVQALLSKRLEDSLLNAQPNSGKATD
ncbi:MAG: hypothetical protein AAGF26_06020, partial [Cyanobacteria bacterium P01_G01_bin.49]